MKQTSFDTVLNYLIHMYTLIVPAGASTNVDCVPEIVKGEALLDSREQGTLQAIRGA
jgi:hypothetical protein